MSARRVPRELARLPSAERKFLLDWQRKFRKEAELLERELSDWGRSR